MHLLTLRLEGPLATPSMCLYVPFTWDGWLKILYFSWKGSCLPQPYSPTNLQLVCQCSSMCLRQGLQNPLRGRQHRAHSRKHRGGVFRHWTRGSFRATTCPFVSDPPYRLSMALCNQSSLSHGMLQNAWLGMLSTMLSRLEERELLQSTRRTLCAYSIWAL